MKIDEYLEQMSEKGASDLYFKVGGPPFFRVDDNLFPASQQALQASDIDSIIDSVLTEEQKRHFELTKELDGAYSVSGLGRFRFNIYAQRNTNAATFRSIKKDMPSFAGLNLPVKILESLSAQRRGLILITGHAGCGKSTTIASMIDYINSNFNRHIITIEDPIEFVYQDKKSIISQREVGSDTMDFDSALRHIIRQSPDIIVIGEMRDAATMQTAIMAAETGHLVLSTLHTVDSVQTIDRIINFFPAHSHNQIRSQLSQLLKGIISMRLVPRSDGPGRVPACEIMVSTPTIKKYIAEGKTSQLNPMIEEGELFGMCSFNQSLTKWLKESVIDRQTALEYASNADELALQLKDILSGGGGNHF
jgi:twitching motility protein PilT